MKSLWGKTGDGAEVSLYTLSSDAIEVRLTDFGAHVVGVRTPDRKGVVADVVLGFDSSAAYLKGHNGHQGAVVGRFGNRIARGRFAIDGISYQIPLNDGPNALHGGPVGFDRYLWKAEELADGVEFTLVSPDGDMGFPGTLTAKVRYRLAANTLQLDYSATTDKPTVLNLTNHSYFNLRGNEEGDILGHIVQLSADRYTPVDATQIPTGEIATVVGTPLDFRAPHRIGDRIEDNFEQLKLARGYDHNFLVNGQPGTLRRAALVVEPERGRALAVETTEPGVQLYSGNFLDGTVIGRYGRKYEQRTGLCLETQHFPDSPNQPNFPSTILRPGERFRSTTAFTFGVR